MSGASVTTGSERNMNPPRPLKRPRRQLHIRSCRCQAFPSEGLESMEKTAVRVFAQDRVVASFHAYLQRQGLKVKRTEFEANLAAKVVDRYFGQTWFLCWRQRWRTMWMRRRRG